MRKHTYINSLSSVIGIDRLITTRDDDVEGLRGVESRMIHGPAIVSGHWRLKRKMSVVKKDASPPTDGMAWQRDVGTWKLGVNRNISGRPTSVHEIEPDRLTVLRSF
jgi:hypothetical protein